MPLTELINEIARQRKTSFLCGAGLCARSGLPVARQFVELLVDEVFQNAGIAIQREVRSRLTNERLERVLEICAQTPSVDLGECVGVLQGSPNAGHFACSHIASCSRPKGVIVTTNFDTLLEYACKSQHISYSLSAGQQLVDYISSPNAPVWIVKVHGSLEPTEARAQIVATLNSLSCEIPL
jgi:NAD-dependent SIR2 family protein deacetylase